MEKETSPPPLRCAPAPDVTMTRTLTDKQKQILALFKRGIELEQKSQQFYASLLEQTEEPRIREIVEFLIHEEEAHEDKLREVYAGLRRREF